MIDVQKHLIRVRIEEHLEDKGIELTDEQKENAVNGVDYWLSETIPDAISDSIWAAREEKA